MPPEFDRLLLIRFAKKELKEKEIKGKEIKDTPWGIAGFYYQGNNDSEARTLGLLDIRKTRYLLLLRQSLSEFIAKHHSNDEFRDWIEADKRQKLALLTGHGREMLLRLATYEKPREKYQQIISTILMAQRFIIDCNDEAEIYEGVITKESGFSVKRAFREFYRPDAEMIDNSFVDTLHELAKDLFLSEYIENPELLILPPPEIADLTFKFSRRILKMICFELLVNAKKNR